jgi:glutathione S-transferase
VPEKLAQALLGRLDINGENAMPVATLTISSKNYSSWSLRGWLMMKLAGVPFEEIAIDPDDAAAREEILLLSPSIRVPCLEDRKSVV